MRPNPVTLHSQLSDHERAWLPGHGKLPLDCRNRAVVEADKSIKLTLSNIL
jgi:hypothetical protein